MYIAPGTGRPRAWPRAHARVDVFRNTERGAGVDWRWLEWEHVRDSGGLYWRVGYHDGCGLLWRVGHFSRLVDSVARVVHGRFVLSGDESEARGPCPPRTPAPRLRLVEGLELRERPVEDDTVLPRAARLPILTRVRPWER